MESPSELGNLTGAEGQLRDKLVVINQQIAATNNTINKRLFVPYVDNGVVKLTNFT